MLVNFSGINIPKYSGVNYLNTSKIPSENTVLKSSNFSSIPISFRGIEEPLIYPAKIIDKYARPEVVKQAIEANPNIRFLLKYNGIEPDIDKIKVDEALKSHMFMTYLYAKDIAERTNLDTVTREKLYKASLLHDIGKTLIPVEIIQKPGKLTKGEREIIDLHPGLGYEILKTTDLDDDAVEAIRLHHIPFYDKTENVISQILSVADVYSALREARVYKAPMTKAQAFTVMTDNNDLSQNLVTALSQKYKDK